MPNDYTFDRFDFTETIEKYLARCQAEREGIAIETLRAMLPRRFVKSRAAVKRMGIKRTKIIPYKQSDFEILMEALDRRQSLAQLDGLLADLLACDDYKLPPQRSDLSQLTAFELFPTHADDVTKQLEDLL